MNSSLIHTKWPTVVGMIVLSIVCLLVGRWWGSGATTAAVSPFSLVNCGPDELGYTCSMHPQLRVTSTGLCPFCQMPLVKERQSPSQDDSAQVYLSDEAVLLAGIQTMVVEEAAANLKTLDLAGKIAVDHSRKFTQVAGLPGRIEALYAQRPGQWIEKGQPIARIYSRELISAVEAFRRPKTPESVRLSAQNNLRDWQVPLAIFDSLVQAEDYRQAVDIYATASGMVDELQAHVGEQAVNTIMGAPTTLYTLVDISSVWAELAIYERDVRHLKVGEMVSLRVDAFPGEEFSAKIISLSTAVAEESRTMTAIAELANPKLKLRPGMLVSATLPVGNTTQKQVRIPRTAVLWTGKRSVAYVKHPDYEEGVFLFRELVLGDAEADQVVVLSGLAAGEELVVNGTFSIDAAAQLQGKNSMMNGSKADLVR